MKNTISFKSLIFLMALLSFQGIAQWEYMEDMPTPRGMCTACELDGKIYVFGGLISTMSPATSKVEVYDPATNTWDTTVTDIPVPLCGASSAVADGKIYIIGGRNSYLGEPLKSVFVYDPMTDTWESENEMTSPRSWHATSVLDDLVYVVGGYGFWGEVTMDSVATYNYNTGNWSSIPNMPSPRAFLTSEVLEGKLYALGGMHLEIPRSTVEIYDSNDGWTISDDMPGSKWGHGSAVVDDTIYVFGGNTSSGPSPGTWKYHPSTGWIDMEIYMPQQIVEFGYSIAEDENSRKCLYTFGGVSSDFSQVTGAVLKYWPKQQSTWTYQDRLQPARRFCTGIEFDGKIYVIGGQPFWGGNNFSRFVRYDPVDRSWDSTIADIPVPLKGAASSVVGGKIYVIGGHVGAISESLNSVYEYDPVVNNWTSKSEMPTPRTFLRTVVIDDKIFAIGGHKENYPNPPEKMVEMYNPAVDTWTTMQSMHTGRAYFSAEVVNGKIYAMGGQLWGSGFAFSSVEVYDPQVNTWTEIGEMPATRAWHESGVINDQIYVFGGGGEMSQYSSWKFNPLTGIWTDIDADMPRFFGAFASSVAEDAKGEKCLYAIAGAGPDLISRGEVYKYCPPSTVSAINPGNKPGQALLFQNYPNPFSSSTNIKCYLDRATNINIQVINLAGQYAATLLDEFLEQGEHEIIWDAGGYPSGIYIFKLQTDTHIGFKKGILIN